MELGPRLYAVAQLALPCQTLADIGTDHAYLPLFALERGMAHRAIATDMREGPLSRAREHLSAHGVLDRVSLRLGNGLEPLAAGEAEVIVSAGLGGRAQAEMVERSESIARSARRLVFQPMGGGHVLRRTLYRLGFHLVHEVAVCEADKPYEVVAAEYRGKPDPAYARALSVLVDRGLSTDEAWEALFAVGPLLCLSHDACYHRRLLAEGRRTMRAMARVQQAGTPASHQVQLDALARRERIWRTLIQLWEVERT
ncbi:tRNA (adenine(22)-N(1))-methyltransferase [Alicyclobacillus vulcanalis]|uniref:tRNA (Adenine22-N1)-methyltransferase n=1 Tax=Alicyclobacillus vulcanalis TaxID=252246 RepID=A0A1N7KYR0_9BACL|nr:class I SAM-dependent methyltransferase [Alicyclobacillus vulcanalis]SIS66540.1 tRNA (adenine22-N1)-methyltransferase [Alicyclobacillus vulcanalis]